MSSKRVVVQGDDLEAGQLVSIHSRVEPPDPGFVESPFGFPMRQRGSDSVRNGGVPLRVLSVNLPYIACSLIKPDGSEQGPILLDCRQVRLMRLEETYLEAILELGKRMEPRVDDDELELAMEHHPAFRHRSAMEREMEHGRWLRHKRRQAERRAKRARPGAARIDDGSEAEDGLDDPDWRPRPRRVRRRWRRLARVVRGVLAPFRRLRPRRRKRFARSDR